MTPDDVPTLSAKPWQDGNEILLAQLSELGLPRRLQNALNVRSCSLVGQLIQLRESDLFGIPAMGVGTVMQTQRLLARYGLSLGTALPDWDQEEALEARKQLGMELQSNLLEPTVSAEDQAEFLLATLEEAGLPQRFINHRPNHGCELVGQLVQLTEGQLYRLDYLGDRSIADARATLRRNRLTFGMNLDDWDDADAFARRERLLEERRAGAFTFTNACSSVSACDELISIGSDR